MSKVYLDEIPELHSALKQFCEQLDLDEYGFGTDNDVRELECRRRDGFIPHSHNHGGFDVVNILETEYDDDQDEDGTLVYHGYRFMYEGMDDGKHVLCGYYSKYYESDYTGLAGARTIREIEIQFESAAEMIEKLIDFVER